MTKPDFPFKREISKEDLEALEPFSYTGKIKIIDTMAKMDRFVKRVLKSEIIGFDTETRPSFKKGKINECSLVQLAYTDEVVLFRLNKIGFPNYLADIFSDERLQKIGIAIHDDLKQLKRLQEFQPAKFVDLNVICPKIGFENIGAKKLSALVLEKRISKRQQVSNWESPVLTDAQIKYAATDAWICREIYLRLHTTGLLSPDQT